MRDNLKFDLSVESSALLNPNPSEFYAKAYLTPVVAENFRVLPGIKYSTKIATTVFGSLLQASTCSFTTDSGTKLSATTIDVAACSAMAELCRFDLEQSFLSLEMAKGSNASFEVANFMNFYWSEMANKIGEEIETIRWIGNTGVGAYSGTNAYKALADGYEKRLTADTQVVDVTLTAATQHSVLSNFAAVLAALPASVDVTNPNLRFYVASNVAKCYMIATNTTNTQVNVTGKLPLQYLGIPIVVCPGMSSSKMVLCDKNNLIYAFDGEGDGKELKAVNLEDTTAEPLLRTRANLKMGFYIVNGAEIVYFN